MTIKGLLSFKVPVPLIRIEVVGFGPPPFCWTYTPAKRPPSADTRLGEATSSSLSTPTLTMAPDKSVFQLYPMFVRYILKKKK